MKLLITVQGVQYEVDVEVLEEGATAPPVPPAPPPAVAAAASIASSSAPLAPPVAAPPPSAPSPAGTGEVTSPIAGNILDVKVSAGDTVEKNGALLVLEAMKMESIVASPQAGTVREVLVKAGDTVTAGQVLIKF